MCTHTCTCALPNVARYIIYSCYNYVNSKVINCTSDMMCVLGTDKGNVSSATELDIAYKNKKLTNILYNS